MTSKEKEKEEEGLKIDFGKNGILEIKLKKQGE